jgi:peptidoglycan/LPS O-acetylase OafA/YrhL
MTWGRFMTVRMIRLWPMLVIGAVLGGLVWTVARTQESSVATAIGGGLFVTIGAALLLPVGLLHGAQAYPADNPIWSLFFEIVANALYAIRLRAWNAVWMMATVVCALVLGVMAWRYGSLATFGFNDVRTFAWGLPRVIVPFMLGVLIYRRKIHDFFAGFPAWIPPLALAAALYFHAEPAWIFELAAVLAIFPLIVSAAAGSRVSERAQKLTWISGEISYPASLVHQPIIRGILAAEQMGHFRLPLALATMLAVAATLGLSWLLLKFVDKPVRRALDHRLLRDKNQRDVMVQPAL